MADESAIPPPVPPKPPEDLLDQTVRQFIAATAAKTPTPGGGSVAALAGALAAGLAEMSLQYTQGKKQFAAHDAELKACIEKLRKAGGLMQELVYEDVAAYQALSEVLKVPAAQREADNRYLPAVVAAISAPQSVGGLALHILELAHEMMEKCNPYLLSDLGAAAALAYSVVHIAELNVLANLRLLPNRAEAEETRQRITDLSRKSDLLWHQTRDQLRAKI